MLLTGQELNVLAAANGWIFIKFLPFANLDGVGRDGYIYKWGVNKPQHEVHGIYFTVVMDGKFNENWVQKYGYFASVPDWAIVNFGVYNNKLHATALHIDGRAPREFFQKYLEKNPWLTKCVDIEYFLPDKK